MAASTASSEGIWFERDRKMRHRGVEHRDLGGNELERATLWWPTEWRQSGELPNSE